MQTRNRSMGLLAAFAAVLAFPSVSAGTDCARWDVSGGWTANQKSGHRVGLNLQQDGSIFTGTAQWTDDPTVEFIGIGFVGVDGDTHRGSIDGRVEGNAFAAQIFWEEQIIGVYTGTIGPQGRIEGETYDRDRPHLRTTWFSSVPVKCAEEKKIVMLPVLPAPKPDPARVRAEQATDLSSYRRPTSSIAVTPNDRLTSVKPAPQFKTAAVSTVPTVSAAHYGGNWATQIGSGLAYQMTLTQEGDRVRGNYNPGNGTIVGQVDGNGTLVFRWTEGRSAGAGQFRLGGDGRTFSGSYSNTDDPNVVTNSWRGERR